jgi:hypothetical protein
MEEVLMTWRFTGFDAYWAFLTELAGAVALRIAALPEGERAAVREDIEQAVGPFRNDRGYELPGLTQNTLAA